MVKVGQAIPEFKLSAYHNDGIKTVELSDYRGKWLVLVFYPADFTFICPTELEEMAENYENFKKENAEVISISTDTVYVHKAWHDVSPAIKKINFPMGADPSGSISRAFGTYIEEEGISLRATFIIDPEGILRCMEIHDNSIGRSAREILRKLRAARFVSEHPGEVCPASWEPGKNTLKPSLELVGKI